MKHYLLFVWAILAFASCSSLPSKPIWEDLTTDELAKILKEDPSFESIYEQNNLSNIENLMTNVTKAKYQDITCDRFYKMVKFSSDNQRKNEINEEWEKIYKRDFLAVDSLSEEWANYLKKNLPQAFVELKMVDLVFHGTKSYCLLEATPLVNGIDDFNYIDKFYRKSDNEYLYELAVPYKQIWGSKLTGKQTYEYENYNFITTNYQKLSKIIDYRPEIVSVKINGKWIHKSTVNENVPYQIRNLWQKKSLGNINEAAKLVNPNYMSQWEYYFTKRSEEIRNEDSLFSDFVSEVMNSSAIDVASPYND